MGFRAGDAYEGPFPEDGDKEELTLAELRSALVPAGPKEEEEEEETAAGKDVAGGLP